MQVRKYRLAAFVAALASTSAVAEPVKTEAVITSIEGNTITARTINHAVGRAMLVRKKLPRKFCFAVLLAVLGVTAGPAAAQSSSAYCDGYAKEQARNISQSSSRGGAVGGAARGAMGGVVFGAITGNAGRGAAIGAGFGAIRGGVRRDRDYSSIYQTEYNNCMQGR